MSDGENPPAFPNGMTLRDWFAAHADVTAYKPHDAFEKARGHRPTISQLAAYISEIRYIEADAMLAARNPDNE